MAADDGSRVLSEQAMAEVRTLWSAAATARGMDVDTVTVVALFHWVRYAMFHSGDASDLAIALELYAEIQKVAPELVPPEVAEALEPEYDPDVFADVGVTLFQEFQRTGDASHLDNALLAFRRAVSDSPSGDPMLPVRKWKLSTVLRTRLDLQGRQGDPADLEEAVRLGRAAAAEIPAGDPDRAPCLSSLALTLRSRFERHEAAGDIEEAVRTARASVAEAAPGHPARGVVLFTLVLTLRSRADAGDDDEIIAACRESADLFEPGSPDQLKARLILGQSLYDRFTRLARDDDLDEAIRELTPALGPDPVDRPVRVVALLALGLARSARFKRTAEPGEESAAIEALRAAEQALPPGDESRGLVLSTLGSLLFSRFRQAGDPADRQAALTAFRDTVQATPAGDARLADRLAELGSHLQMSYEETGSLAHLDESIHAYQDALARPGDHDRVRSLGMLSTSLRLRYELAGDAADLDAAVSLGRAALTEEATDPLSRLTALNSLGNALMTSADTDSGGRSLDEAIAVHRVMLAESQAGQPLRAYPLMNLANGLRARYERDGNPADLDEAILLGRQGLALETPLPDRPAAIAGLGFALLQRHSHTGDEGDLAESIDLLRAALRVCPPEHPVRARLHLMSGLALHARFTVTRAPHDLREAVSAWRQAAGIATGDVTTRLRAARTWAFAATEEADAELAVDAYAAAVGLLPLLAWPGLDRGIREERLSQGHGLASEAAAWAIMAGRPDRALELLEQGRTVLWAQDLRVRADLSALREAEPDLAARLDHVRARLDGGSAERQAATTRRRLVEEWDELARQVSELPGFERFLRPYSAAELCAGASGGPVVVVNVSRFRCDALVVTTGGVEVVPLPRLTEEDVVERANLLLYGLEWASARFVLRDTFTAMLAWLWEAVAEPVLSFPAIAEAPAARLWWCPTGALTFLPLHAAGLRAPDSVPDRVVSSYTPSLAALVRAGNRPPAPPVRRCVVGVSEYRADAYPEGRPSRLPGVAAEVAQVSALPGGATVLRDGEATREAVLRLLARHEWSHFACHGRQDLRDPAKGALCLYDGPLPVLEIAEQRLPHAELAYLSACSTAIGGGGVPDEAVHPAAALQVAGYRHVIATLWPIADHTARAVAGDFYTRLGGSAPGSAEVAHALHGAVNALRAAHPDMPEIWAPYLHIGP
ncbi:CHAT domain-containing protein [Acrocarpospora corrugata]|uniref:CHAT domain-containing protein n=1 Tax=Acrocarpospora corrugata TaxID=35763 RepID=A0A5M3W875_9ACTN|nr:CHAT domain-containing protein [Acrocarpospora corrugata]